MERVLTVAGLNMEREIEVAWEGGGTPMYSSKPS